MPHLSSTGHRMRNTVETDWAGQVLVDNILCHQFELILSVHISSPNPTFLSQRIFIWFGFTTIQQLFPQTSCIMLNIQRETISSNDVPGNQETMFVDIKEMWLLHRVHSLFPTTSTTIRSNMDFIVPYYSHHS